MQVVSLYGKKIGIFKINKFGYLNDTGFPSDIFILQKYKSDIYKI